MTVPRTIEDPRLVSFFMNSAAARVLLTFVDEPRSVSAAAALLGLPLERVHYYVTRLAAHGLLTVVREQKRAGRPIRFYRSCAERFFVPIECVDRSLFSGLAAELRASLDEEVLRWHDEGALFFTAGGKPRVSWSRKKGTTKTAGEFWQILNLTDEEARRLAAELRGVMTRYGRDSPGGRPYLFHAAFAPRRK